MLVPRGRRLHLSLFPDVTVSCRTALIVICTQGAPPEPPRSSLLSPGPHRTSALAAGRSIPHAGLGSAHCSPTLSSRAAPALSAGWRSRRRSYLARRRRADSLYRCTVPARRPPALTSRPTPGVAEPPAAAACGHRARRGVHPLAFYSTYSNPLPVTPSRPSCLAAWSWSSSSATPSW